MKKEMDSLRKEVMQLRKEGKLGEAFILCEKILSDYKASMSEKDLAKAYVQAGNILSNLSRIKESFQYLDLALESGRNLRDAEINAKIYGEYGRNYNILGFRQKAIENYSKSIGLCEKIDDARTRNVLLQYLYSSRGVIYEDTHQLNALYKDLTKSHKVYPDTYTAARIAKYFTVHRKNLDSAKYYLEKGKEMFNTGKFPIFQKSVLLRSYGRYYYEKKDYDKAISFYKESLLISKDINKPQDIKDTYKVLHEAYKAQENKNKANENLEKYTVINDSLNSEIKKLQEIPVKQILKEKEVHTTKAKNNLYLIILVLIALVFIIWMVTYKTLHSSKLEKEKILLEKNYDIDIKQSEIISLQQKVNESFDEVVQLAKANNPEFFTRFQEVYPDVIDEILKIDSKLRVSELTLCAYIFLGFTTKDIALHTFKSVNTVRNRKHNLKKKLKIPTEESMELWLKNFGNKSSL